jgi:hypothetical protein
MGSILLRDGDENGVTFAHWSVELRRIEARVSFKSRLSLCRL